MPYSEAFYIYKDPRCTVGSTIPKGRLLADFAVCVAWRTLAFLVCCISPAICSSTSAQRLEAVGFGNDKATVRGKVLMFWDENAKDAKITCFQGPFPCMPGRVQRRAQCATAYEYFHTALSGL